MDKRFYEHLTKEEDEVIIQNSIMDEVKADGIMSEKNETAKRMLEDGVDPDTIVKYTGLSIKDIQKLKETE